MKPITRTWGGMTGWFATMSTLLRTASSVSPKPASHLSKSMPQCRAHDAAEGVGHLGAGHLDDFRVAVLQPQRRQQQRGEARVHARDDGQLLVGVLVGGVTFEVAALHERAVVREDAVDGGGDGRLLLIHKSLLSSEALMIAQPAPAQCANECFT